MIDGSSHLSTSVDVITLFQFPDDERNEQQREEATVNQSHTTATVSTQCLEKTPDPLHFLKQLRQKRINFSSFGGSESWGINSCEFDRTLKMLLVYVFSVHIQSKVK